MGESPPDARRRCPFCRAAIEQRRDGVRCSRCATPHHGACWEENRGRCTVAGCGGTDPRPFTRSAATRIVIGAGRAALRETNRRLGGKTVVGLLCLSGLTLGLAGGALAIPLTSSPHERLAAGLGALFLVLATWITALIYRGSQLEDDMDLQVAGQDVGSYYRRLWSGIGMGDAGSGCADLGCSGCGGLDAEGLVLLPVLVAVAFLIGLAILLVGPLLAWLALELVWPLIALAVYWVLHAALALAVNGNHGAEGRLGAALLRGVPFAFGYTAVVGLVIEGALLWVR